MNMLTIFCLAILLHDDIIDWQYFAWQYYAGNILLAIFLSYTKRSGIKRHYTGTLYCQTYGRMHLMLITAKNRKSLAQCRI